VKTVVDLIRHGEPVGGKKYRGWLDDPLSDKGWRQMRDAVGDHCPWQQVVTSPLCRCADFAREVAARHALPMEVEPRFREMGFGQWEGMTAPEILALHPDFLARFWRDPLHNTPPGGEPLTAFRDRVVPAWDETVARHAGKHLLVVGHAGMMRMVLRHVLDMPLDRMFRFNVENAGVTRIEVDHHDGGLLPRLVFHGGRL
jgi:alpha-ribazole phosphatase/probable phosphoglycerate mutase